MILRALEALERCRSDYRVALLETLGIADEELTHWEDVSRRMFVPFHDGVISQFEGYERPEGAGLGELSNRVRQHAASRPHPGGRERLRQPLQGSPSRPTCSCFSTCCPPTSCGICFDRLGYRFAPDQIPRTVDYYLARTSHGSTLSAVVHAWVVARSNRHQAMQFFGQALSSDIVDIQGGTTAEGIHLAAMAGSIDLLQRCFTGLEIRRRPHCAGTAQPKVSWAAGVHVPVPRTSATPERARTNGDPQRRTG